MASSTEKTPRPAITPAAAFREGLIAAAPFLLVIIPFATLFGVVGTEAGLNLAQVMGFSVLVIAGAAQFTAVQLMADNAPTLVALASALAVNLRMAMYSASLTPYLGGATFRQRLLAAYGIVDQSYALSIMRFEAEPDLTLPVRLGYFMGTFCAVAPFWYGCTFLGAVLGSAIPDSFALDFALPITFLALIAPALRTLPHVVAAVVSAVAAVLLVWVPYSLGLLIAAALAMAAGVACETWLERRR